MSTTTELTQPIINSDPGDRFLCEKCGMEIEIIRECNCEQCDTKFTCCNQPLKRSRQGIVSETKEAFVEEVQTGLESAQKTLKWLQEKTVIAKEDTKEELSRDLHALTQQYEKLKDSLAEVKESTNENWERVSRGYPKAWQRFKAACKDAFYRYQ